MSITLQDIARQVGVTPSTVQRALAGTAGVSPARREEIRRVAQQMGYRINYHASSLKRGLLRVAVVLSQIKNDDRYYAYYMWKGIEQASDEFVGQGVELVKLTTNTAAERSDQCSILERILNGEYGEIHGVVTRGPGPVGLENTLQKLRDANLPVVLIGSDVANKARICCVKNVDEMQGHLAADLLIHFGAADTRGKIILCGDFRGTDQYRNAKGFESQILQYNRATNIHMYTSDDDGERLQSELTRELLQENAYAIYTCSARSTVAMCGAVKQSGKAGGIYTIGSDIFSESIRYMREGVLKATLHTRPIAMARQALQVLVAYLAQGGLLREDTIYIDPIIIMPGNLDFYSSACPQREETEEDGVR
ncbi:MAG: substrate-binding domain-containing protein [Oscillospiraceae bacterium]|jgi:LacI family transcriptional regulator|nr:substrate-binding domain-containing protein [Oscillospiraceae bacterium]